MRSTVAPVVVPPRFFHWKTLLLISVGIWLASLFIGDQASFKNNLAMLGWILLTVGICWRTTYPPFVIGGIPLSPWITSTLICISIYAYNPTLAVKLWPLLSAILLIVVDTLQVRMNTKSSFLFDRAQLILILLLHLLLVCWIELYLVGNQWYDWNSDFLENNPNTNPIIQPNYPPTQSS
ncbi:MAG: DUF5357 domain-containing protein [Oscillatoriales cyanobacterium RM2_1_1]|nr:DUF5357 domain-containing protein [Oscillatoriales cyanobacterium SM2_3_0]NJO45328.1 DUF5357 domain-containing protein [Oscillatoriales cyanobacterium RM2_1_1]